MVTSVVPTVCVSTACGLAWGYLTWPNAGTASKSVIKASLRIVPRSLPAVGPDEETILQQRAPAAAVDDLDLQVGVRGDAGGTPLELAHEARLGRGAVPRKAAAQRRIVEEERRDADASVLQQQGNGADAGRRQREGGEVGGPRGALGELREVDEAEGVAVVRGAAREKRIELGRAVGGGGAGRGGRRSRSPAPPPS